MVLEGARIYNEGVSIEKESEQKISQIVTALKTLSPASDVSMRFLKYGKVYEGLLWGKANDYPIGAYFRGPSMSHVLDTLYNKVKKECLKIWRLKQGQMNPTNYASNKTSDQPLSMAG
jgi:hypothetical protein